LIAELSDKPTTTTAAMARTARTTTIRKMYFFMANSLYIHSTPPASLNSLRSPVSVPAAHARPCFSCVTLFLRRGLFSKAMNTYAYEAVNAAGLRSTGLIEVESQGEAVRRIKEMGLFPMRVAERHRNRIKRAIAGNRSPSSAKGLQIVLFESRVKPAALAVLTRQIATLVDAGLPLLRGLRILQQQETRPRLKRILGEVGVAIESGRLFSESLGAHPKVFNKLYVNMVRAGEAGGTLETSLRRLAEFMEKAQKIRGKVQSAMFYPLAVMLVASGVMALMMVFVIPRFKEVFTGLTGNAALPAFTTFILNLSDLVRHHAPVAAISLAALISVFLLSLRARPGRRVFDQLKLKVPLLGPVFRKSAISRFARTLGTLLGSGVPVLQALNIVRETAGNTVFSSLISRIHDSVKEGGNLTEPMRASTVFPPMVSGMVDVGEQTGALPDMLLKIADGCDDEVDNAVSALTSLLEPIMIVFLAVVVGSIVIAMFLPILAIINGDGIGGTPDENP
jgi:type IV pilus assembly protein PilC